MRIELAIQAWLDSSLETLGCDKVHHFDAKVRVNYHIADPMLTAVPGSLWHSPPNKLDLLFHESCVSLFRTPLADFEHLDDTGTLVRGRPAYQAARPVDDRGYVVFGEDHRCLKVKPPDNIMIPYSDPKLFEKIISFSLNK